MHPRDIFLATLVAVIWGLAFVASRLALDELPPTLMTTLRFAIAAVPCLFVRKPDVSWPLLIAISVTLFLGQFLAQAFGIAHGVPVGLASVIVQSQALFTIAFAVLAFGEVPTRMQAIGIGIAAIGLLMICGTVGYDFSVGAFAVLMICPVSFAVGNLLLRRARDVPMFDLFAWLCLASAVPLLALTLIVDGPQPAWHSLLNMSPTGVVSILTIGAVSTSIAYWLWGRSAARLYRGAGGAVRAAGAVRRRRRVEHRIRRTLRAAAPGRHGHRGRRHCDHAAVEAVAGRR